MGGFLELKRTSMEEKTIRIINGKTISMLGLAVAALMLLSGLWCVYFSPVSVYGPDIPNNAWQRILYEPCFQTNFTVSYNFKSKRTNMYAYR